jgi:hypothetical protein
MVSVALIPTPTTTGLREFLCFAIRIHFIRAGGNFKLEVERLSFAQRRCL